MYCTQTYNKFNNNLTKNLAQDKNNNTDNTSGRSAGGARTTGERNRAVSTSFVPRRRRRGGSAASKNALVNAGGAFFCSVALRDGPRRSLGARPFSRHHVELRSEFSLPALSGDCPRPRPEGLLVRIREASDRSFSSSSCQACTCASFPFASSCTAFSFCPHSALLRLSAVSSVASIWRRVSACRLSTAARSSCSLLFACSHDAFSSSMPADPGAGAPPPRRVRITVLTRRPVR